MFKKSLPQCLQYPGKNMIFSPHNKFFKYMFDTQRYSTFFENRSNNNE